MLTLELTLTNFNALMSAYQTRVDPSLVAEWHALRRDTLIPALHRFQELRASQDYSTSGRERRLKEAEEETKRLAPIQKLRDRAERARARRDELRSQALAPTAPKVTDLQGLFDALVLHDETKQRFADIGRDPLALFSAFAEALETRDAHALRVLAPLRRHLSPDHRDIVDQGLIATSSVGEELALVEADVELHSAILSAVEADLRTAAGVIDE